MTILDLLASRRVVPVVVLEDPNVAKRLADALIAGGLPIAEVTFRTDTGASTSRSAAR